MCPNICQPCPRLYRPPAETLRSLHTLLDAFLHPLVHLALDTPSTKSTKQDHWNRALVTTTGRPSEPDDQVSR